MPNITEKNFNCGLIGLGVMGKALARNIASKGFSLAVYNRTESVTKDFINQFGNENLQGFFSIQDFIASLQRPKVVMIMVKAGPAVDAVLNQLLEEHLEPGDIIIDLGNSFYEDSERRLATCKNKGIHFLGTGVSGGEEGALTGPSIMAGGDKAGWDKRAGEILTTISAQADGKCATYVGGGGSGHFVKMVHNGIEYADMQLIAESYDLMKEYLKLNNQELGKIFSNWSKTKELSSFLIEITADIFTKIDPETNKEIIDLIVDQAGQKGTGKWTVIEALKEGVASFTLATAVFSRFYSADKKIRNKLNGQLKDIINKTTASEDKNNVINNLKNALYLSRIIAYSEGFYLIGKKSKEKDWNINLSEIARVWTGGCIIRSSLLAPIKEAFLNPIEHLLEDYFFQQAIADNLNNLSYIATISSKALCGMPCFNSALNSLIYISRGHLPLNLTQAQRDYFGAHGFQRVDKEGIYHFNWT